MPLTNIELHTSSIDTSLGTSDGWYIDDVRIDLKPTSVPEEPSPVPYCFTLYQNYPNPFNPETEISFSLPEKASVYLDVYNVSGQKIRVLTNATFTAGLHKVTWDGTDRKGNRLASGVYFCRLLAGANTSASKMILVK